MSTVFVGVRGDEYTRADCMLHYRAVGITRCFNGACIVITSYEGSKASEQHLERVAAFIRDHRSLEAVTTVLNQHRSLKLSP